jgi:hypothetical protein
VFNILVREIVGTIEHEEILLQTRLDVSDGMGKIGFSGTHVTEAFSVIEDFADGLWTT